MERKYRYYSISTFSLTYLLLTILISSCFHGKTLNESESIKSDTIKHEYHVGVYEFGIHKKEIRNGINYTIIHRHSIISLDSTKKYEFYYETQNEIIRTRGDYIVLNDSVIKLTTSSNKDFYIDDWFLTKWGDKLIFPFFLLNDYEYKDTLFVLTKSNDRKVDYPWCSKNKDNLRDFINAIRLDSLDWDYAQYTIQIDSIFNKVENPRPYLMVNSQPVYDLELDNLTTDEISELQVLSSNEARSILGSRGKYGAIFIKLKDE